MMANIVKDWQRSQQQQRDQDLWKFSAVSAVAATTDLVENELDRLSRGTRNARSRGSGQGSNATRITETRQFWKRVDSWSIIQVWKRIDEVWNGSAIGQVEPMMREWKTRKL